MGDGFFAEVFSHVGQWGTHVDPPAHFLKGGRTVDQITLREMILPLVVIDVHEEVARNPDETTDTDPGLATSKDDYALETYVLRHDHYQKAGRDFQRESLRSRRDKGARNFARCRRFALRSAGLVWQDS